MVPIEQKGFMPGINMDGHLRNLMGLLVSMLDPQTTSVSHPYPQPWCWRGPLSPSLPVSREPAEAWPLSRSLDPPSAHSKRSDGIPYLAQAGLLVSPHPFC